MDVKARIRRRRKNGETATLVQDYGMISPISHVPEPTGRGPVLERLLDYLDPVFEGALPPDAYLWGPKGAGKSAVVTALVGALETELSRSESVIPTSTRIRTTTPPRFVYVDARQAHSPFALFRTILDALVRESVPEKGIGTDTLRSRLTSWLATVDNSVFVAVDHVGEPETVTLETVSELLAPLADSLTWVAIGRTAPTDVDADLPPTRIEAPAYQRHALVDILTDRASEGLAQGALQHEQTQTIAAWADGDAHDAFAALFGAADRAATDGRSHVDDDDLTAGMDDVPRRCRSLAPVMALSANRQRVLRALVDLDGADRSSVDAATSAIVDDPAVDLSAGTVKRFLYELAETGVVERVRSEGPADGHGRPPSRVEPRFPTTVFGRLYDLRSDRNGSG
jgi:Cdc6-like AAA superfamily ATPase